jgi:hypothetical protein
MSAPLPSEQGTSPEQGHHRVGAGQGAAAAAPLAAGGAPAEGKKVPNAQIAKETDEKDAPEAENSFNDVSNEREPLLP